MKTTEVSRDLIGKRCECIFTSLMVTGVIEDIQEDKYTVNVKVCFDHPHEWGNNICREVWAWGSKIDDFGTLEHLKLLPDFQTMVVVFSEPISQIDTIFSEDTKAWGVCSLQDWINSYESIRFVAIDDNTAVITGEYNMEKVEEWLQKFVPIKSLKIS